MGPFIRYLDKPILFFFGCIFGSCGTFLDWVVDIEEKKTLFESHRTRQKKVKILQVRFD
jgi:hypothetical protein